MQTVADWVAIAIFAGLIVILLQRSVGPRPANDRLINYLPPALGCAVGNYLGNHDRPVLAAIVLVATVAYIFLVLKPGAPAE